MMIILHLYVLVIHNKQQLLPCIMISLFSMQGANPVTDITKRPVTVGTHFKNDVCNLIELLQSQVYMYYS